ncbi:MAG: hypothetical protein AAF988_05325 [Pseudomonadota bacterium]
MNMTQRQAYLDREKLYKYAAETSRHHFKLVSDRVSSYVMTASLEATTTFPPLFLLKQFSKAVQGTIHYVESKIGKRPALKAAAAIEATFHWTPDPISEIVASTLVAASLAGFAFEKIVGEERANKVYAPFHAAFKSAVDQIPSSSKNSLKQAGQIVISKVKNGVEAMRDMHSRSPAMTVYKPNFLQT